MKVVIDQLDTNLEEIRASIPDAKLERLTIDPVTRGKIAASEDTTTSARMRSQRSLKILLDISAGG